MGRYLLRHYIRQSRMSGLAGPIGRACVIVCVVEDLPGILRVFIYWRGILGFFLGACTRCNS